MKEPVGKDDLVYDVLTKYPELKSVLQEVSPKFKKLDNPLAFNTLARVTTLERAAKIGGVYLRELLYRMNDALGLGTEYLNLEKKAISASLKKNGLGKIASAVSEGKANEKPLPEPVWLPEAESFPKLDLRSETSDPFDKVIKFTNGFPPGSGFLLIQSFEPLPLILHVRKLGFDDYTRRVQANEYWIYFYKK